MNFKHPSFIYTLIGLFFFLILCFLNLTCGSESKAEFKGSYESVPYPCRGLPEADEQRCIEELKDGGRA